MRKAVDVIRVVLAGIGGSAASVALLYAIANERLVRSGSATLVERVKAEQNYAPLVVTAAAALAIAAAALYARWFDALLSGPAVVRGLKYGLILGAWSVFILVLFRQAAALPVPLPGSVVDAIVGLAGFAAFGLVLGLVYGTGRHHNSYQSGLGYGLPQRTLISEVPGARASHA